MITRSLIFGIAGLCLSPLLAHADSPITSISFSEGYDLEEVYSHDRDLIVRELALGDSPTGEKLAVAAEYPDKKELVGKLRIYLMQQATPGERADLLLILAYAMMVNNPNDVETPKLVLALAYPDYSDKESLLMLESLVQGQDWLNGDEWKKIYPLVSQYQRLEPSLIDDVGAPVTEDFLRYLNLYEKYCEDCEDDIGPSFSCSNADKLSKVENLICGSSRLSRADRVLAEIYSFAQREAAIGDVKESQLNWLSKRANCADERCIDSEYSDRIEQLVGSITVDQIISYIDSTHQSDPQTMLEIQEAEKTKMEVAYEEMDVYLTEALTAGSEQQELIRRAQESWEKYADAHCDSVYERWSDGSVRFYEYYRCQKELAIERTYVIWKAYLTYADSTPPVLPDPRKISE